MTRQSPLQNEILPYRTSLSLVVLLSHRNTLKNGIQFSFLTIPSLYGAIANVSLYLFYFTYVTTLLSLSLVGILVS